MAFSKSLLAAAIAVSVSMGAQAQSISDENRALVKETEGNIDNIIEEMELEVLEQRSNENMQRNAPPANVADRGTLEEQRQQAKDASDNFYREHEIVIFASLSLKGEGLDDILAAASANPRIAVVFRGVPEGMKIDEGMEVIQRLAYTYDPMPTVAIDPTMFDEHAIDAVPAIVVMEPSPQNGTTQLPSLESLLDSDVDTDALLDDIAAATELPETRKVLAKVQGLTEPMWIKRQLDAGRKGDMGIEGPLSEIEEPHLVEVMKQKALGIDWEAEKQGAVDRFWTRQSDQMKWLPVVTEERTRRIDPSVTVVQDIVDGRGNILTPKGTEINPLDHMPFDIALVIFDGDDPGQVELAREEGRALEKNSDINQVMYLMTQFDTLEGWDGYESISDTLDRHVYLLNSDVEKRFEIEKVPSIVTADNTHFIVEEMVAPSITNEPTNM